MQAIADMTCLGFYFLLCPGEHTHSADNTPFTLQDVAIYCDATKLDYATFQDHMMAHANSVSLTFTTQKNGVRGEVITHGCSGHPWACPVKAVARRLLYHRANNAPADTALCTYYRTDTGAPRLVRSRDITLALRAMISKMIADNWHLDIRPDDVDARSLRAGGATALLCGGVDDNVIQLIGRWKSDAMIRYLHVAAHPVMHTFAAKMFANGNYSFRPGFTVPMADA